MLHPGMHRCWMLLLCLGVLCPFRWALADTVHLLNGDRLTGHIAEMDANVLFLDTEYADRIQIQREQIKTITSDQILTLHFTSGERVQGIVAGDTAGGMTLNSPTLKTAGPLQLAQLAAINPKHRQQPKWNGEINLAANLESGNTDKTGFSIGMNAQRKEAKHRLNLGFLYNYAKEEGELSERNAWGKIKYDYFIASHFYSYLSTEFLHDRFKDLRLRTVIGPGVGYQLWDDEIKALAFEAGAAYFNEDSDEGEDNSWITGRLAVNFRYRLFDKLIFTEQITFFPSLENLGDFTLRNEAAISSPLAFGWALRLASIIEHDSDPEPGIKKTDYDLLLGLQYQF